MTCAAHPHRKAKAPDREEIEVAGTWDYKWPLGTTIRVAFQRPADDRDFDEAKTRVQALAQRWTERIATFQQAHPQAFGSSSLTEGIGFQFVEQDLEPPLGRHVASQGETPSDQPRDEPPQSYRGVLLPLLEPQQNRSPFAANDPELNDYDVLVSFADLPVHRVDPFRLHDNGEPVRESVHLPFSEIGSYARRVDYGEPTLFLGRFGESLGLSLKEYLATELAESIVVHEFGHVLGLAHAHQNPLFEDRDVFVSQNELRKRVVEAFGVQGDAIPDEFLSENLLEPWPGNVTFSDWGLPKGTLKDLRSVMTYPHYQSLLKDGGAVDIKSLYQPPQTSKAQALLCPTTCDIEDLLRMYWPCAYAQLPSHAVSHRAPGAPRR